MGGADKTRLTVGGQTILARQTAVLGTVAGRIAIIANDAARFAGTRWPVVPDVRPGAGVTGALYTAVEWARSVGAGAVVTVGGDMPFLDAALLAFLLEIPATCDGRWVRTARGAEPLLSAWRPTAAAGLAAAIEAGALRAGALDAWVRIDAVDDVALARFGPPERLTANINTPDDLASLELE